MIKNAHQCAEKNVGMRVLSSALEPCQSAVQMEKPIFLITGQSGAGKSTVLHVFEDMRLFTADGVPPSLIPEMVRLFRSSSMEHFLGLALGLDQRRGDVAEALDKALPQLKTGNCRSQILYLEADPQVLMHRYAITRRPHPLEREGVGLERAVREEIERLAPVREIADQVIDTTNYSIHDLRRYVQRRWNTTPESLHTLKINLISFGFKYGVPKEADLVFDLRFLPNPYFIEKLRPFSGKDEAVANFVFNEPLAKEFKKRFIDFLSFLLPLYDAEGRYRLSIALGCTGGKHRSVAMTEALKRALERQDYVISVEHRHMELG